MSKIAWIEVGIRAIWWTNEPQCVVNSSLPITIHLGYNSERDYHSGGQNAPNLALSIPSQCLEQKFVSNQLRGIMHLGSQRGIGDFTAHKPKIQVIIASSMPLSLDLCSGHSKLLPSTGQVVTKLHNRSFIIERLGMEMSDSRNI